MKIKNIALTGILGALALSLSFLESLLPPLPILPPGTKPGLSNIVTMLAAGGTGLPSALFIALIKGFFAFFTRGFTAGVLSLSGGLVSTALCGILLRKTKLSILLIAVCGALSHNAAQLLAVRLLTSTSVVFYIPWLLIFGVLTGIITGLVLRAVLPLAEPVFSLLRPQGKS